MKKNKPLPWSKWKAVRTVVDGISFPSKCEANVYRYLKMLERQGLVRDIELQCRVDPPRCEHCGIQPAPSVKVDFRAFDVTYDCVVYFEAKGLETDRWKSFIKWWRANPPAVLRVFNSYASGPMGVRMVEEICPKAG